MSSVPDQKLLEYLEEGNVTTRRKSGSKHDKMALTPKPLCDLQQSDSIFIDTILSQDESNDILSMMIMADEHHGGFNLPSFCTSTQMGGRLPTRRPMSPQLSPLTPGSQDCDSERAGQENEVAQVKAYSLNELNPVRNLNVEDMSLNNLVKGQDSILGLMHEVDSAGENWPGVGQLPKSAGASPSRNRLNDMNVGLELRAPESAAVAMTGNLVGNLDTDPLMVSASDPIDETTTRPRNGNSERMGDGDEVGSGSEDDRSVASAPAGDVGDKGKGKAGSSNRGGVGNDLLLDLIEGNAEVNEKMKIVDRLITRLDDKSAKLDTTVKGLETSLEYSQHEIEMLKNENAELKKKMGLLEMEDKRTRFQLDDMSDKVDRVETFSKKKNLIFEGIPESEGRREDVERTICKLFDQLSVTKSFVFEACYRVGPYNQQRQRAILVSFERQADRDAIYARRMDLKRTQDFQRVWINEDVGPLSRRKRDMIRMITREAQAH